MAETCDCLTCDVIATIEKHYPDGLAGEGVPALLGCLADIAAQALATCGEKTTAQFLREIQNLRRHHQVLNAEEQAPSAAEMGPATSRAMH